MKRYFFTVLCAIGIVSQSFALEHGKIGIGVETYSLGDILSSPYYSTLSAYRSQPPFAMLNLRLSLSDLIDLDVSYGLSVTSAIESDTATRTYGYPSSISHVIAVGCVFNVLTGENAVLGIYGRFAGSISKSSVDVGPSTYNSDFIDYYTFQPKIGIGAEPSYYFSKNYSMYFRAGLGFTLVPASKYAVLKAGGDPAHKSDYDLKNNKDGQVMFGVDGVAIGLRFLFGK
jgi:hypothetical protein